MNEYAQMLIGFLLGAAPVGLGIYIGWRMGRGKL